MPSKNLDQNRLFEAAVREGTAAFQAAISQYPQEQFYAFSFYTDNDVTSLYPVANTVEGLQRIDPGDDPEERNYYQWTPDEWDIDFGQYDEADLMAETNQLLQPTADEYELDESLEAFGERKRCTLLTLNKALLSIRETGIFSGHSAREKLAFWVNIGDPMPDEVEWMLNPTIPHLEAQDAAALQALLLED